MTTLFEFLQPYLFLKNNYAFQKYDDEGYPIDDDYDDEEDEDYDENEDLEEEDDDLKDDFE